MSGGIAYVYDEDGDFARKCNMSMVALEPVQAEADQEAKMPSAVWHSQLRGGASADRRGDPEGPDRAPLQATPAAPARATLLDDWAHAARASSSRSSRPSTSGALAEMDAASTAQEARDKVAA